MTYTRCHRFTTDQGATNDAVRHACGTCGGDKRAPIDAIEEAQATVAELTSLVQLTRTCLRLTNDDTPDAELHRLANDLVRFNDRRIVVLEELASLQADDDARQADHIAGEAHSNLAARGIL